MEMQDLHDWLIKRKKKQEAKAADPGQGIQLPNGMTIHIHVNTGEKSEPAQKLPLSPDGKSVATRDAIAQYPG